MAVTVTTTDKSGLGEYRENEHSNGFEVVVSDGHLFVEGPGSGGMVATVAVYAPGKWHSAVVEQKSE